MREIEQAIERANAELAAERDLPRSGGECPICGHKGCFGRLRGRLTHWVCYSSNHPQHLGRAGEGPCVWGDLIDLELALAGRIPTGASRVVWLTVRGHVEDAPASRNRRRNGGARVVAPDWQQLLSLVRDPASLEAVRPYLDPLEAQVVEQAVTAADPESALRAALSGRSPTPSVSHPAAVRQDGRLEQT